MVIRLANYAPHKGNTRQIDGVVVINVLFTEPHDIRFQKYRRDYKARDARPYKVGSIGYASLRNAVKAVIKNQ